MFVRSDVTGVRSSCEASATSCRCAAIEPSSVSSIALKRAASSPTSSWLVDLDPASEVLGLRDVARRLGHAHDRRDEMAGGERGRAPPPARPAERPAPAAPSAGARARRRSTPASARAGSIRRASSGTVSTRTWSPSTSASERNSPASPFATARVRVSTGSSGPVPSARAGRRPPARTGRTPPSRRAGRAAPGCRRTARRAAAGRTAPAAARSPAAAVPGPAARAAPARSAGRRPACAARRARPRTRRRAASSTAMPTASAVATAIRRRSGISPPRST